MEVHFKGGKEDGLQTHWYPKGKWWHINGYKKSKGYYKDGKKYGLWTEWSEDGKKTFEGNFVDWKEPVQEQEKNAEYSSLLKQFINALETEDAIGGQ